MQFDNIYASVVLVYDDFKLVNFQRAQLLRELVQSNKFRTK